MHTGVAKVAKMTLIVLKILFSMAGEKYFSTWEELSNPDILFALSSINRT
jgi:hypothetical protein